MKAAAGALQTAIFALLNGDTGAGGLMNPSDPLVTGIFDFGCVEKNQAFPYVTIGDVSSDTWGTAGRNGELLAATVHVWTQGRKIEPAHTILNRLNELLGDATLTVPDYDLARSLFDTYQSIADPSDRIQHLVATYNVWMQEA